MPGSRRFTATVFCVLAQASKTKCTKEDDKKPTDFTAFLNKVGENKSDVFEKLKEAAMGLNGNNEIDFGSMLDSKNVRKIFENGVPGQVCKSTENSRRILRMPCLMSRVISRS